MGRWKLSYPSSLDTAGTYDAGKALYDKYGAEVIGLGTAKMCRAVGKAQSVGGTGGDELTCTGIINYPNIANTTFSDAPTAFETDEFNQGFVRLLSGVAKDNVYRIDDTTASVLHSVTDLVGEGVLPDDYFEVVSGGCTFEFPVGRNPNRRDFKRIVKSDAKRFPYYAGGLFLPIGYEADDTVLMTYFTDERDADRLELMCNHLLDYKGGDGVYTTGGSGENAEGLAPMILETGNHDIRHQHLVFINDYKIVKDAKRSDDFWEIMLHFMNFSRPLYRGM